MFKAHHLVLLVGLASATGLSAATYYVSKTGSDSNAGSSASPWLTMGHAASTASSGDTVNIAAGSYSENVTFSRSGTSGSPITFIGTASPSVLTIALSGNYVIVSGLAINPQSANGAYGVYLTGTGDVVTNCNVTGCYDQACVTTSATASGCIIANCNLHDMHDVDAFHVWGNGNFIRGNTVTGLDNPGYTSLPWHADFVQVFGDNGDASYNNVIENNYVHDCAIQLGNLTTDGANIHDLTFRNNIFVNINNAVFNGVKTMFYNNLFINVGAGYGGAIAMYKPSSAYVPDGSVIENNVFIGYSIGFNGCSASQFNISYNYFGTSSYGALGTIGTSVVNGGNPVFVNAGSGNYHIMSGSVLIDKGTTISGFAVDADGNSRPQGTAWDIGPYEYGSVASSTNPIISISPTSFAFGILPVNTTSNQSFTVRNTGGGTLAGTASVSLPFSIVSGASYSLGANQSQSVTVRYSPSVVRNDSQSVTFTGGGGATATVSGVAAQMPSPPQNLHVATGP